MERADQHQLAGLVLHEEVLGVPARHVDLHAGAFGDGEDLLGVGEGRGPDAQPVEQAKSGFSGSRLKSRPARAWAALGSPRSCGGCFDLSCLLV